MTIVDAYGRKITYLRVSLTKECNLRCGYCYGGLICPEDESPRLSDIEIIEIIRAFALLGINKIRFTGGEPLLRKGIVDLIKGTSCIEGVKIIALTTNGVLLSSKLDGLVEAGLNRLNVSLDSPNRDTYKQITGSDCLKRVLTAIELAENCGRFGYIKVNVVVMKGINDTEIPDFVRWALPKKIDLRFIEFMPVDKSSWKDGIFLPEDEIKSRIGLKLDPVLIDTSSSGPAVTYRHKGFPGRISFISAVSRGFCHTCNRLRLTSEGCLVGCLFGESSIELKPLIENSASAENLSLMIKDIVRAKYFRKSPDQSIFACAEPSMRSIGG